MTKKEKLALGLAAGGALLNIADAFTAKGDPTQGIVYGDSGFLKAINDKLPLNVGLLLILAGAGLFLYVRMR